MSFGNEGGDAGHKRRGLLSRDLFRGLKFNGHLPVLSQQVRRNPNLCLSERTGNGVVGLSTEGKSGY